jgi:cysteinyl-tRNA synthetase
VVEAHREHAGAGHEREGAGLGQRPPLAVEERLAARQAARQAKNFAEADRIRKELADKGIVLEDKGGATTWRRS